MKPKFLEILLAAAIALTATNWSLKDEALSNTYHRPDDLLEGQIYTGNSFSTIYPHRELPSLTLKEEQTIIDTIINLEETQQQRAAVRPITNFFAYPLVSQNSDGQSYESDSDNYVPSVPENVGMTQEGLGSPLPGRPGSTHSWPTSPPSPIDDGGLFGAIGYAPWSNNQYFDIETFLNADLAPEIVDQDFSNLSQDGFFFGAVTDSSSWADKGSESATVQQSESLDELSKFLEDSIESPGSPDLSKKDVASFNNMRKLMPGHQTLSSQSLDKALGSYHEKQIIRQGNDIENTGIGQIDKVLGHNFDDTSLSSSPSLKGKVNPIANVRSYDSMRDEPMFMKGAKVKKEVGSPQSSDHSWGKSSDNDYSGYASSSSSSFDNYDGTKRKSKSGHDKKIWLDLPYTKDDFIQTTIEDFNDIVSKLDPLQQHIAKDIRRKGKNKLAARNCRKRKIDAIETLGNGLGELESEKQMLLDEKLQLQLERDEIVRKTEFLYEHIFKNLRDERGQPYSKDNYALTYTVDGAVYLVPKKNSDKEEIKSQ